MACSEDDTKDKSKIGVRNIILSYTGRNNTKKQERIKGKGVETRLNIAEKGNAREKKGKN